jgi:hypothetical protein
MYFLQSPLTVWGSRLYYEQAEFSTEDSFIFCRGGSVAARMVQTAKIVHIAPSIVGDDVRVVLAFTPRYIVIVMLERATITDGNFEVGNTVELIRKSGTEEVTLKTVDR